MILRTAPSTTPPTTCSRSPARTIRAAAASEQSETINRRGGRREAAKAASGTERPAAPRGWAEVGGCGEAWGWVWGLRLDICGHLTGPARTRPGPWDREGLGEFTARAVPAPIAIRGAPKGLR